MTTSRSIIGSRKAVISSSSSNGPIDDVRKGRGRLDLNNSDSATPETNDEADDDRTASEKLGVSDGLHNNQHSDDDDEDEVDFVGRRSNRKGSAPSPIGSHISEELVFEDDVDHSSELLVRLQASSEIGHDEVEVKIDDRNTSSKDRLPIQLRRRRSSHRAYHQDSEQEEHHQQQQSEQEHEHEPQQDQEQNDSDEYSTDEMSNKAETWVWRSRMACGRAVNNEYVQILVISLILINALMMGLATMDFVTENPDVDNLFTQVDKGFLVVFTIEVLMQLYYLGVTLFSDGWLVFDLFIVIFSWSFESLQIIRAFRIFRAFRLITRVKPLRDLVLAIGAVLPRMYAIAALLLLIFYIFAVLFTELFSEFPLSENYFGTLDASLFTCMQMMTLEWGDLAREVMLYAPWAWAPIVSFIALTGFIVFNLIVAVVCDAVAITEKTVRKLDGFESDNPVHKLEDAQERIDLLQCHLNDMLKTQALVQNMVEVMAGELLHLEAERMKAEHREAELRIEMSRRMMYEQEMEAARQIETMEKPYVQKKEEKKEAERKARELRRKLSNEDPQGRKVERRGSATGSTKIRSNFVRDLSFISRSSSNGSSSNLRDLIPNSPRPTHSKQGSRNREMSSSSPGRRTRDMPSRESSQISLQGSRTKDIPSRDSSQKSLQGSGSRSRDPLSRDSSQISHLSGGTGSSC